MKQKSAKADLPDLARLRLALDEYEGRYKALKGAANYAEYVNTPTKSADEETLTDPLLQTILESVLGFGKGGYFPQLGRSGLKPDLTPHDLIAHSFVLDAKGSGESLGAHVGQIKAYVDQRSLAYGVLFNLKEFRVYERGRRQHSKTLSFPLLPLWQVARGEAIPGPEVDAFVRFLETFRHRTLSVEDKIAYIRTQTSWAERLETGEDPSVDVEFLVEQEAHVRASPGREARLVDELKQVVGANRRVVRERPGEQPERKPKRIDQGTLAFRRGRIETGRVSGPPDRIDLVGHLAGAHVDDIRERLLPRDLAALEAAETDAVATVTTLLLEGRKLVEEVERLVCGLYDVPADLTDAVVEHAVARAARALPAEG